MVKNRRLKQVNDANLWWRPNRGGRTWFWLRRYTRGQSILAWRPHFPWSVASRVYRARTTATGWWRIHRVGSLGRWRRIYRTRIRPGWPRVGRPQLVRLRWWRRLPRRWGHRRNSWRWRTRQFGGIPREVLTHPTAIAALYRGHNNFWGITRVGTTTTEWTAGQFVTGSKRGRHHAALEVARAVGAALTGITQVTLQLRGLTHPRRREELLREVAAAAEWTDQVRVTLRVRADRPHNGLRLRKARRG